MTRSTDSAGRRPSTIAGVSACLLWLLIVAGVALGAEERQRPATLGVALAYPKSTLVVVPRTVNPYARFDLLVPINFHVSADGSVTSVTGQLAEDSILIRLLDSILRKVEFVPGKRDSEAVAQVIPAELALFAGSVRARLSTPVTDSGRFGDPRLYAAGLQANSVSSPLLNRLAPVFFTCSKRDSLTDLPYALLKIDVNADGKPGQVETVRTTMVGFTDQIASAFNWADYTPARVGETLTASTVYAVVIYHPRARYPTRPIGLPGKDTAGTVEQFLIRLVIDTEGVMIPPIPASVNADSVGIDRATGKPYGPVSVWCTFDTSGQAWPTRMSNRSSIVASICREAISEMRFHPATDFHGRRVAFSGLMYFDFAGSGNVRVYLDWLRRSGSKPFR
ncbi:MAG: hypothetical protein HY851_11315 [candidate division Zixibacteria bacterium]|nr:hypothetical protein [candidate division Zixibacteria bacterium]